MDTSKYLPIGTKVADKYEVLEVLGEDDFEILYLVRDSKRKKSFFVIKELFLDGFSFRKSQDVANDAKAEGVFQKRKHQIIVEVGNAKSNPNKSEIKIYGYEEDNNTIYTVMEFSNNAGLEKYLQYIPKDTAYLPDLKNLLENQNKGFNHFLWIKLFALLAVLGIIAFFSYQYLQRQKSEPKVVDRPVLAPVQKEKVKLVERHEPKSIKVLIPSVEEEQETLEDLEAKLNIRRIKEEEEKLDASEVLAEVSEVRMEETSAFFEEEELVSEFELQEALPVLVPPPVAKKIIVESIETRIQNFLDAYMGSSSNSPASDTLTYYDTRVKKYFKFKNAKHQTIRKSQERYNKKWFKRDFKIVDFKILKNYKKNNISYVDVKTTTLWHVSNKRGKKLSGKSRGFMTLKEVDDGFKISSIYALK